MLLAILAGGFILMMEILAPPVNVVILLLMGGLALIGLHLGVSEASLTFARRSCVCTVRRSFIGLFGREWAVEFSEVVIQRRVDWNWLRWIYRIILADKKNTLRKSVRIGYMTNQTRCEALATRIARFTNVVAVDYYGRILQQAK